MIKDVLISAIRMDGNTQSRALDQETVTQYAEAMADGTIFPPIIVYHDGTDVWPADGFHRIHASLRNGEEYISAEVLTGTQRDAELKGMNANNAHGKPPTRAERCKNAQKMVEDFEWSDWKDTEIARHCGVSQPYVSKIRNKAGTAPKTLTVKTKDGYEYERTRSTKETKAEKPKAEKKEEPKVEAHNKDQETIDYLMEQNEKLSDQLATVSAPDPKIAEETIQELREEIKQLKIELKAVTKSRDTFQAENAQLKKTVAGYQRQLKKVEK